MLLHSGRWPYHAFAPILMHGKFMDMEKQVCKNMHSIIIIIIYIFYKFQIYIFI